MPSKRRSAMSRLECPEPDVKNAATASRAACSDCTVREQLTEQPNGSAHMKKPPIANRAPKETTRINRTRIELCAAVFICSSITRSALNRKAGRQPASASPPRPQTARRYRASCFRSSIHRGQPRVAGIDALRHQVVGQSPQRGADQEVAIAGNPELPACRSPHFASFPACRLCLKGLYFNLPSRFTEFLAVSNLELRPLR